MTTSAEGIKRTKTYKSIKRSLIDHLERTGKDTAYFLNLVEDYMSMYVMKELANADILENGVSVEYRNSETQYGRKQNDSVNQVIRINRQMTSILKVLGIKSDSDFDMDDDEEM